MMAKNKKSMMPEEKEGLEKYVPAGQSTMRSKKQSERGLLFIWLCEGDACEKGLEGRGNGKNTLFKRKRLLIADGLKRG